MSAMPIGIPGCPESAFCTASIDERADRVGHDVVGVTSCVIASIVDESVTGKTGHRADRLGSVPGRGQSPVAATDRARIGERHVARPCG